MEESFNLAYKNEIEELKDEPNFEQIGDEKYMFHKNVELRLLWAFYRPSGSHEAQIEDSDPLVSIMAFNHSRLGALERFKRLHKKVIEDEKLRVKIRNRTRMLFRALCDDDFIELNKVLNLVPCFIDLSVDQLINGRKWNDIDANLIEATKYLHLVPKELKDEKFYEALFFKIANIEDFELIDLKNYLDDTLNNINKIDKLILEHIQIKALEWLDLNSIHILQKKAIEKKIKELVLDS